MAAGSIALSMLPTMFGIAGYVAAIALLTPGYQLFQAANNTAVISRAEGDIDLGRPEIDIFAIAAGGALSLPIRNPITDGWLRSRRASLANWCVESSCPRVVRGLQSIRPMRSRRRT